MTPDERPDAGTLLWRKSTYSNAGNECVEVAQSGPILLIRDSKKVATGGLVFESSTWRSFVGLIRES